MREWTLSNRTNIIEDDLTDQSAIIVVVLHADWKIVLGADV
ncbi:MAG: hypothetical protein ACJARS_005016, partial [bacterium]